MIRKIGSAGKHIPMTNWRRDENPELWILPNFFDNGPVLRQLCKEMNVLVIFERDLSKQKLYNCLGGVELRGWKVHDAVSVPLHVYPFVESRVRIFNDRS